MLNFGIILIIFGVFCNSLATNLKTLSSDSEIDQVLISSPELHVGFVGTNISDEFINDLNEQLGNLVKFYRLTYESSLAAANQFRIYPFGQKNATGSEYPPPSVVYTQETFNINDLIIFLDKNTPNNLEVVNAEYIETYIKFKIKNERKLVWVMFEPNREKKNLALRTIALTSRYKPHFAFVLAFGDFKKIINKIAPPSIPFFVAFYPTENIDDFENDDFKINYYHYGGLPNYGRLINFLDKAMDTDFQEDFMKEYSRPVPEVEVTSEDMQYVQDITIQSFDETAESPLLECEKKVCLIAFERFYDAKSPTYEENLTIFKTLQMNFGKRTFRVLLLDGICYGELLAQLGQKPKYLPTMSVVNYQNKQYVPYRGDMSYKEMFRFMLDISSGKKKAHELKEAFDLKIKPDCRAAYQKLNGDSDNSQKVETEL